MQCFVKNEQCLATLLILNVDKPSLVQMQYGSYDPLSTQLTDDDTKYRPGFVTVKHVSSCPMFHASYFLSVWAPITKNTSHRVPCCMRHTSSVYGLPLQRTSLNSSNLLHVSFFSGFTLLRRRRAAR